VRTVDFVSKLGPSALRPFLYMQHELNRRKLSDYPAYVNNVKSIDYEIFSRKQVDRDAHFDVTGARSVVTEQRRRQQLTQVTFTAAGSPLFAPLLIPDRILQDMYRDAGKKNPEEYVKPAGGPQIPPQVQEAMQKMQQTMQQLQQENQMLKAGDQTDRMKIQMEHQVEMAKLALDERVKQVEAEVKNRELNIKAAALKVEAMLGQIQATQGQMELRQGAIETALGNQLEAARLTLDDQGKTADRALKASERQPVLVRPKRRKKLTYENGNVVRISEEDDPNFTPPEGSIVVPAIDKVISYDDEGNIKSIEDA
jgi:hypothetical protein